MTAPLTAPTLRRAPDATRTGQAPRSIDSRELLPSSGELQILHQGETYRLRQTRQGKLILTK